MNKSLIKDIVDIAIVSAIYIVLTVINPFSFSFIQLRISEALVLLSFFNKKYIYALSIGVFISNFFNVEFMLLDIFIGTLSTLIATILIYKSNSLFLASIYPVITSILVALEMYIYIDMPLYLLIIYIVTSMAIVEIIIGYPIFKLLSKNKQFLKLIDSKKEGYLYEI